MLFYRPLLSDVAKSVYLLFSSAAKTRNSLPPEVTSWRTLSQLNLNWEVIFSPYHFLASWHIIILTVNWLQYFNSQHIHSKLSTGIFVCMPDC